MGAPSPSPSHHDLAAFWRFTLEAGLCGPEVVVAWADDVIARSAEPPEWSIELSMAPEYDVPRLLNMVAGSIDPGRWAVNTVVALARREWLRRRISMHDVGRLAWDLHVHGVLPESPADWGVAYDAQLYDVEHGLCTEGELEQWLLGKLAAYAPFEQQIPPQLP